MNAMYYLKAIRLKDRSVFLPLYFQPLTSTQQSDSIMGGAVVDDGPPGVKAPDGGWGWAVLAGCFIITGFSYAFPKAVSVFFKELIREFDVGYSDTAWISSILLAMLYGTGRQG